MANSSSARKRIRASASKHDRNRRVRSSVRTAVARARRAVETSEEGATEALRLAASALDKAAEHGVLHPRNAARRKSRLMRAAAQEATPVASTAKRVAAKGTKPKAAAAARKAAPARSGRAATKTERTSSSQRRAAGDAAKDKRGS